MGFGFRGSSPPWPYVGIGRGGLQSGYYLDGPEATEAYQQTPYSFYPETPPPPGETSLPLHMTKEEELDFLRFQAKTIKGQLEQIETRMIELDSEE
jgi:hypothetical protein